MRLTIGIAAVVSALFCSAPASADQAQLQALLAKYFLRYHHAVPLHNNGDVKSQNFAISTRAIPTFSSFQAIETPTEFFVAGTG